MLPTTYEECGRVAVQALSGRLSPTSDCYPHAACFAHLQELRRDLNPLFAQGDLTRWYVPRSRVDRVAAERELEIWGEPDPEPEDDFMVPRWDVA